MSNYAKIRSNPDRSSKHPAYAQGGKVAPAKKSGGTTVNVIVPSRGESKAPIAGSAGLTPPPSRMPAPPVAPPAPAASAPVNPAAAQAALGALAGGKPMFAKGGAVKMKGGAAGGLGRLEKAKSAKAKRGK